MNRLEMIKAAAEKVNKQNAFRAKMKTKKKAVRKGAADDLVKFAKKEAEFDKHIEKLNDNTHMYWNDASQFSEKYYGDTYRETTKFDNEWN